MAREKPPEPPPEDIPAWFMTYSDVITLLMTFFILLLTFSTTEPEKFDKVQVAAFGSAGATGIVGHEHKRMDNKSWIHRVRPRAARIAMHGAEMPPMNKEAATQAVGRGLEAVNDEEAQQDVMTTNSFQLEFTQLVNENGNVTPRGVSLASMLAKQLRALPVNCTVQYATEDHAERAAGFLKHLYEVHGVRPGQVGIGLSTTLESNMVGFDVERFEN